MNYSKILSNEVSPKGMRILTVSPGFIQIASAERMVERLAESSGISIDEALKGLIAALVEYQWADRRNLRKLQNWWVFWFLQGPVICLELNM